MLYKLTDINKLTEFKLSQKITPCPVCESNQNHINGDAQRKTITLKGTRRSNLFERASFLHSIGACEYPAISGLQGFDHGAAQCSEYISNLISQPGRETVAVEVRHV